MASSVRESCRLHVSGFFFTDFALPSPHRRVIHLFSASPYNADEQLTCSLLHRVRAPSRASPCGRNRTGPGFFLNTACWGWGRGWVGSPRPIKVSCPRYFFNLRCKIFAPHLLGLLGVLVGPSHSLGLEKKPAHVVSREEAEAARKEGDRWKALAEEGIANIFPQILFVICSATQHQFMKYKYI